MATTPQPTPDFAAIFDAFPNPVLVLSPQLVIVTANQAWLGAATVRREEAVGRPLFEFLVESPDEPNGSAALLRASLARVLDTRRADRMPVVRFDFRATPGRLVPRSWSATNFPVLGLDGAVRYIVHAAIDVSAEVRASEEARLAREREAYIISNAKDYAILTMDADRRVTCWSPGAAQAFGYSEDEALGMPADQMFTPEDRAADVPAKETEQARREGRAPDDRWHLRKDGTRVYVRGSVRPLYAPDGTLAGYLKIARNETREQEFVEALEAQAAYFRALADSMPVLVVVADASGAVTFVNRRFQEFSGLSADALIGEGWANLVHPDDVAHVVESWKEAVASGQPFEAEARLRACSGEHRWFLVRATPYRDAGGAVRHWFGAWSDIDKQHRVQDRQVLLNKEISHRVKNSLQLVSGFLALQARTAPETARPLIEEAANRVRAVGQVHDQLWRQPAAEIVHLDSFLSDLCESLSKAAPRHETRWDFEPASVPTDVAAPIGLTVNEALTNAYKYAYPVERSGPVEVRGACSDGQYRIEIRDWGVGVPEGFDLDRPGESLGLRVINAIAKDLGAQVHAENAGPGTRFTLIMPLAAREGIA